MDFFKQAQEFAASANVNTDNEAAAAPASGGFGSFMSEAQNMLRTQTAAAESAPAQSADSQSTLPGGRKAPTNAEMMESTKLLFAAAEGQKVDKTQLAGAAEDLLGGLTAHGKLDEGQYGTYINQAEQYLHKYAGEDGQAAAKSAPALPAEKPTSEAPAPVAPAEDPAAAPATPPAEEAAAPAAPAPAPSADEGAGFSLPASVPSWMSDRA